jgi:hypothetical protein
LQGTELLGNDQGSMVGQHNTAGANANRFGGIRDMSDEHGSCRTGKARNRMMFG